MSKEQQNQIFSAAIDEAVMLLEKQGEFFPFAMALKPDETIAVYSAYDGEECPPSNQIINHLIEGLRQEVKNQNIFLLTSERCVLLLFRMLLWMGMVLA